MLRTLFIVLSLLSSLLLPSTVLTDTAVAIDSDARSGFKSGIKNSGGTSGDDIGLSIQNVVNILLFIAGVISVVVIVVAGLRFVLSSGDPGAASKARNTIIYAVVGLTVSIMAYAIVNFILANI